METLQKENTRIKKYFEFSKELGREVENTSFSAEFLNEVDDYNEFARYVNKELEDKKHIIFNKREYALEWVNKIRGNIKEINDIYIKLSNEVKNAQINDKKLIIKKRIKKLETVRYFEKTEDDKGGINNKGYLEVRELTNF